MSADNTFSIGSWDKNCFFRVPDVFLLSFPGFAPQSSETAVTAVPMRQKG